MASPGVSPHGFCMACGGRLGTVREEGRRRLRCRRCGWTFYGNPVPAAVALVMRGRRVLLARRAAAPYRGTWDLPGGFVEGDETPEVALRRELKEELGVAVRSARFLSFFHETYGARGFPILVVLYQVRLAGAPRVTASDVSELRWFERTRLPFREIKFPSVRHALRQFAQQDRGQQGKNGGISGPGSGRRGRRRSPSA